MKKYNLNEIKYLHNIMFESSSVKIVFWIMFLLLFYNLLIKLVVFIGLDEFMSRMYIFWISIILLFISILNVEKIDLNI
jgi:hypothetical protein